MAKSLVEQLAALERLPLDELRAHWAIAYGVAAPRRASRDLLLRAAAYHLQAQTLGGLNKVTHRRLAVVAGSGTDGATPKPPAPPLKPGTRLVREWHGAIHQVSVLEEGFAYCGKHYRSLSEIAGLITGARWSGPRFFGLRKEGAKASDH